MRLDQTLQVGRLARSEHSLSHAYYAHVPKANTAICHYLIGQASNFPSCRAVIHHGCYEHRSH